MEPTGINLAGISRQSKLVTERRRVLRHRTHSPAYARVNESPGDSPELSEILDISEAGMSIQTSSPLPAEPDLNLCLDLSETKTRICTRGQVVWSDTSGRAGIRFAQLPRQSLDQLNEWLFVNVLTAFDHAGATSPAADRWNNASNNLLASHSMAQDEVKSGAAAISSNGRRRAALGAVPGERASERERREEEVESNGFDREITLQLTAERALALTRATGAAIALAQGSDSEMVCLASAGSDAPPFGTRLHVGSGFSGECVRTGRSLRCDDSETDDRVDREGCKALGIRSMIAVPIRPGNKVAGLLEVFSPQPYAFNANDISTLQQLTGSILPALIPTPAGHSSAASVQRAALPRTSPAPIEPRPANTRTASPTRPVTAVKVSGQLPWHKILLVSAIATFAFAVLWLVAPWISSQIRSSSGSAAQLQVQAPSKSPHLPGPANDLASLRKVAERGDPAAQFALGARYATGEEVKQDYTEAVKWFTLAAEQGHILAQATLGAYYWAGRGVPQDLNKAYYWSVLAQAGGDQASKYRVAVLASRMSRSQVLAAQQQANDWLSNFAGRTPASSR